jgi:hypothetical protein
VVGAVGVLEGAHGVEVDDVGVVGVGCGDAVGGAVEGLCGAAELGVASDGAGVLAGGGGGCAGLDAVVEVGATADAGELSGGAEVLDDGEGSVGGAVDGLEGLPEGFVGGSVEVVGLDVDAVEYPGVEEGGSDEGLFGVRVVAGGVGGVQWRVSLAVRRGLAAGCRGGAGRVAGWLLGLLGGW